MGSNGGFIGFYGGLPSGNDSYIAIECYRNGDLGTWRLVCPNLENLPQPSRDWT